MTESQRARDRDTERQRYKEREMVKLEGESWRMRKCDNREKGS